MDSITTYEDYAKRCVALGHKILSSVEHGHQSNYHIPFKIAKKYDLQLIIGTEAYYVRNRFEKDNSNKHIIILAKTEKGRRALNDVLSEANISGYYYKPRLDMELIMSLPPDDVLLTTACIGFWGDENIEEIITQLHGKFNKNFYFEIQNHASQKQIDLNKKILKLSQKFGIEMIAGLDSHYIYEKDSMLRNEALFSKGIKYEDEDAWYMDYPNDETVIDRFVQQGVFTKEQITKAMNATDQLLDFEDYSINNPVFSTVPKLPSLYGNSTQDEKNKIYGKLITKQFNEYMKSVPSSEYSRYYEGVKNEVDTYRNTGMVDYPLINYEIIRRGIEMGGVITQTGRGCFTGDALVHTKKSIISIKDIKIGDEVISADGTFNKVVQTFSYDINEELIQIKHIYGTDTYYPTICTKEHKVLINRNNDLIWCEAKNLKQGDYVCVPKIKNIIDYAQIIDLVDYNCFGYKFDDKYIYEYRPCKNNEYIYSPTQISRELNVSKGIVERFANGSQTAMRKNKKILEKFFQRYPFKTQEEYVEYIKTKRTNKIKRYIKNDEIFNIFIGLMYGDGFKSQGKYSVGLAINTKTKTYNKEIFYEIANRLNLEVYENISKIKNLAQLYMNSSILSNFISKVLFVSSKGNPKEFNDKLFDQPIENLKGIIKGLRCSDGSNTEKRINFDNTSSSIINAYKILCLIINEGINSLSVRLAYKCSSGYTCQESYKLRLNPDAHISPKKHERIKSDESFWYLPIKEVVILPAQKNKVYDICVKNQHNYLINNMIVHNSAVSYFTNTLCGFSNIDRFTSDIKLYPERFISESRILETKSLPDIDFNVGTPEIFEEAQKEIIGDDHVSAMIAFGTFKKKSAFKLYAKAQTLDFEIANVISKQIEKYETALKYADEDEKDIIDIYDYVDIKYKNYIEQSKEYWGIVADKKKAPSAYLLYAGSIRQEIGLIKCKSESTKKEYLTTIIDGAIAEDYKFLKNDILTVTVVLLIDKIYRRIGIKTHTVNELLKLIKNNSKVWSIYQRGLTLGVNQVEKEATTKKVMKYSPQNITELSTFIAAIRPGFKSMYSVFESREAFSYGIPTLDNLLITPEIPMPYMVFQEQVMLVLNYAGFPMDECYGIIKAISKKHPEIVSPLKDRFTKNFSKQIISDENIDIKKAEEMSLAVWRIIEDNANYSFNASHAYCMGVDSAYCAYLKSHYPYEFYEILLQTYSDKGNKDKVAALKQEMRRGFRIQEGKYKWGADNRKFAADKNNNVIYPSLLSIKGMSQKCADDLYNLSKKKTFSSFYELIKNLKEIKNIDSAKLKTLIQIGYFDEFASINKIEKFVALMDKFYGRLQFNKDNIDNELLQYIIKYSASTDKQYRNFDFENALIDIWNELEDKDMAINQRLQYELSNLGYVQTILPKVSLDYAFVQGCERVFKNFKIMLYRIRTGEIEIVKVKKDSYDNSSIQAGDIIKTIESSNEGKWSKDNNGEWQQSKTNKETILKKWSIVRSDLKNERNNA